VVLCHLRVTLAKPLHFGRRDPDGAAVLLARDLAPGHRGADVGRTQGELSGYIGDGEQRGGRHGWISLG